MISRCIFVFLLLLSAGSVHAQATREVQLRKSYESEKNPKKKFSRLFSLAEYYKTHNIKRADSLRPILLDASRDFEDSIRFKALFYNAEVAILRGDQEEYFQTIVACQPFLNTLDDENVQFLVFRHLGFYHSSMQEYQTADLYLDRAYRIANRNKNYTKKSEALRYMAINFMYQNEKDSSLHYIQLSIQQARKGGNRSELANAFNTQAQVYDYFGQVEISVAKNMISLYLAEEVGNRVILAEISREIGRSQEVILNFDDAQYYYNSSLNYARQISDERQIALALSSLASVQLQKGELDQASRNADRAIWYLTQLKDYNGLGETHNLIGLINKAQGRYNLAVSNFNKALIFYESTSNKEKIAGVYHNVGTVFKEQKKYSNALNYLNRSIEIREQYGARNQIYNTYRVMADVYKATDQKEQALKYMELYLNYIDSNTTLQAATKIAELSESYRAEQRERLISAQTDSLKRQSQERTLTATKLENIQLRNNFQMYIIVAFVVIIVLASIIMFYRWNQTKIKQQQLETEMSQRLLRSQMNPHFVFNAMSVIQSYIFDNDTINSSKFLVNFSRLMRLILENSSKEFISITTEVEILQKYLEMQKLRFQDRFEFDIHVDELLYDEHANIPPMITQPFIENAIEHGQLHTIEGGFIRISFQKNNEMLCILIEDNGIGRKKSKNVKKSTIHKSMAMDITGQRIAFLNKKYKSDGSLSVEDYDLELETGTKVLISLPYTTEANHLNQSKHDEDTDRR
jgi:tetratricopeptide (TPR) repeat protein